MSRWLGLRPLGAWLVPLGQHVSVRGGWRAPLQPCPALPQAVNCRRLEGKWESAYLELLEAQAAAEARQSAAFAACRDCHSGGALGPVLCENGEW